MTDVKDMGLPTITMNALLDHGVKTSDEVSRIPRRELRHRIPMMGNMGVAAIDAYFEKHHPMTDELEGAPETIQKHMVTRFLGWKLPEDFNPDNGVSFKATFNDWMDNPPKCNPVGTNLFNVDQTTEMVRYLLEGCPTSDARIAELAAQLEEAETNIDLKADWIEATMNDMGRDEQRIAELEAVMHNLMVAYKGCNGEDHPSYEAADRALKADTTP